MRRFLAVKPQEFSRWSRSQIEPDTLELDKRKLTAAAKFESGPHGLREFWYVASYDVRRLTHPWINSTIRKTFIKQEYINEQF
jgi:hypothetical protein